MKAMKYAALVASLFLVLSAGNPVIAAEQTAGDDAITKIVEFPVNVVKTVVQGVTDFLNSGN